jgi:hypothetical protein
MDQPQGNGSPQDPKGDDAPKYVTEEQLNRAITARFADFQKKSEKGMTEAFGKFESLLVEKLSAAVPAPQSDKPEDKSDPTHAPAYKALQKQLDEVKASNAKIEAARAAERAKGRDMGLRQALTDKLTVAGFSGVGLKHAVGILIDANKAVRYEADDSDTILFKTDDGDMPFEDGLRSWAKSDEAKLFLPPRGAAGSGGNPGGGKLPAAPTDPREAAKSALVGLLGG